MINDRYQIKRVLGQGGFGRTYIAIDEKFQEFCVLKEFLPSFTEPQMVQMARELFEREAQILYRLKHPQIPKLIDYFEDGGRLFLAQEYVNGFTYQELFQQRVKQGKTFSEAEVIQWLKDLLPVLDYIHSEGVIHRDISPDNIMLPNGKKQLPVLLDFGAVKQVMVQLSNSLLPGTSIGKHFYSSPEQFQMGQCHYSSDIYSLGVTAIVLLCGKDPKILFVPQFQTWKSHQKNVSARLTGVLDKMLAENSQNRYQSAGEVLTDLQSTSVPWRGFVLKTMTIGLIGGISLGVLPLINPSCKILDKCVPEPLLLEVEGSKIKPQPNQQPKAIATDSSGQKTELTPSWQDTKLPPPKEIKPQIDVQQPNIQLSETMPLQPDAKSLPTREKKFQQNVHRSNIEQPSVTKPQLNNPKHQQPEVAAGSLPKLISPSPTQKPSLRKNPFDNPNQSDRI